MSRRASLLPVLALSCLLFGAPAAIAQSLLKLSSGQPIQPLLPPAQPALVPSPTAAEFGQVDIHFGGSPQKSITFTDSSQRLLTISSVSISEQDGSSFQIARDDCTGETIEFGGCTVEVSFDPGTPVAKSATLVLSTSEGETVEVPLSGEGVTGTLAASSSPLSFSSIPYTGSSSHGEGSQNETDEIKIQNIANGTADIESVAITGPAASSYSIQWGDCEHDFMQAHNDCTMGIRFEPVSLGANNAQLVIASDSSNSPLVIPLEGEGLLGPKISMSSKQALLGEVLIGSSTWQTFTLTNSGDYPLGVQQAILVSGTPLMFPVLSDSCTEQQIKPSASCSVTVGFQPTTPGEKDASILFITSTSLPLNVVGIDGVGVLPVVVQPTVVQPAVVQPAVAAPTSSPGPALPALQAGQPGPAAPHVSGPPSQWLTLESLARVFGASGEEALETGVTARCPAVSHTCEVQSFITADVPVHPAGKGSANAGESAELLGASAIELQGGASARVHIPLLGRAITLLRNHGRVQATIGFVVRADGTTVASRTRAVTLVCPIASQHAAAARTAR